MKSKRTLKDVKRTWNPEEIYTLITEKAWPYKTNIPYLLCRDRAFLALLYLTAGRISEVLSLIKSQFDLETDPEFVIIRNMLTEKIGPSSEALPFREEFPLARSGILSQFTQLILEYIPDLEPHQKLFSFSRQRGWQIAEKITGKWPHWFRAQGERLYSKLLERDVFALKELLNVASVSTLSKYISPPWRESRDKLAPGVE
ncbi:MAG: hypothetical protein OEW69_08475 [Nitrospirota bacterium]|nr:hypothetical protein [Nitrospirota bacterium]